jgi:hypothetical protein
VRRLAVAAGLLLAACGAEEDRGVNPVGYFEIPVADLDRASEFYEAVFVVELERATVDGYPMALFPAVDGAPGATGALAKGDVYVPGKAGPILYFAVADIDGVLARAAARGSRVLYPKKVTPFGPVAEFEDSEGNRIALSERRG